MRTKSLGSWITTLVLALLLSASETTGEQTTVDVNSASIAQLNEVSGIGNAKAQAIVEYRDKNGPFESVDDLRNVKGIGDKLLARLRPQLSVGNGGAKAPAAKPAK
jgi:competence protein ComEA